MWQKLSKHRGALSALSGLAMVLAFSPIGLWPLVLAVPLGTFALLALDLSGKAAFRWGFLQSFVIMLGGFYWVTYVIHEFGYLSWGVSALLYLGFCGFGALNFPVFIWAAARLQTYLRPNVASGGAGELWFTVTLPALFTLVEYAVPKLFPWYVGHAFDRQLWLIQIAELTGSSFLTFLVFCWGGALWLGLRYRRPAALALPLALTCGAIGFSLWRLYEPPPPSRPLRVAIIQANIGSLEKAAARRGSLNVVSHVLDRYEALTQEAVNLSEPLDLIVWPETAMPFTFESGSAWSLRIEAKAREWNVPLLTGAYSPSLTDVTLDYNAAVLLLPTPEGHLERQVYRKNILLAFGEYFPGGDLFPGVYRTFPQVSHFARGMDQEPLLHPHGVRLGVSICYEAIDPAFYRKVMAHRPQLGVNLTNDSWFGPTSEPHQHGALSIFRAVEHRVPLVRSTNTGVSFIVDRLGRVGKRTPVYAEGLVVETVQVPEAPASTLYQRWGEWFLVLCALAFGLSVGWLRRQRAALPV